MQYISPLHLLELPDADAIDRKDLLLAKKKMLAELELNDGKGVEINGKELSRNDIIRFFDDLQQSSDLSWHAAIYRDKALLAFLEHATLDKEDRFADNPLYRDPAFIEWIGPYYADAFIAFAKACFQQLMDQEWAALLANPMLMNGYLQETAWQSLEPGIEADIETLNARVARPITQLELNEVSPICEFRHVQMLGRLPVERFARQRDELAFAIMQVCIAVFNHTNQSWARNTIDNAHILAVSEELKKQVYDKKYEMDSVSARRGSSAKVHWWTIVRIALFVLFAASRLGNCHSSSNNYNTPVYFEPSSTPGSSSSPNADADSFLRTLQNETNKMKAHPLEVPDSNAAPPIERLPGRKPQAP